MSIVVSDAPLLKAEPASNMQPPDWLRRLSIKKGELSETNMATLSVGEPQEMEGE